MQVQRPRCATYPTMKRRIKGLPQNRAISAIDLAKTSELGPLPQRRFRRGAESRTNLRQTSAGRRKRGRRERAQVNPRYVAARVVPTEESICHRAWGVALIAIWRDLPALFVVTVGLQELLRLERMKLHAGSQSRDEPYCQDHGGDDPSPASLDLGHLEFAAGDARAVSRFHIHASPELWFEESFGF